MRPTIRSAALVVVLSLMATAALVAVAPPASACIGSCGAVGIDVEITPDWYQRQFVYGHQVFVISVTVADKSGTCNINGGCDNPTGTVEISQDGDTGPLVVSPLRKKCIEWDANGCSGYSTYNSVIDDFTTNALHADDPLTLKVKYVPGGSAPFDRDEKWFPINIRTADTEMEIVAEPPREIRFGDTVTLGVSVKPRFAINTSLGAHLPTGDAVFTIEDQPFLQQALDANGFAQVTTSALPIGTYFLAMAYAGDGDWTRFPRQYRQITVTRGQTATVLTQSATRTVFGEPFMWTASVAQKSGSTAPTGEVRLNEGSRLEALGPLTNGSFTTQSAWLVAGMHSLTANYQGDSNYEASSSPAVTHTVVRADTTTTLSSPTPNPTTLGDPVTLQAHVGVVAPGSGTLTGTVAFRDGSAALGAPVNISPNGDAALTTNALGGGPHSITAVYSGDVLRFNASTSAPLSRTVTCTTTVSGAVNGNYAVPASGTTCISAAQISGNLAIPAGAKVSLIGSSIGGSLTGSGTTVLLCGTSINGGVTLQGAGTVTLGDVDSGCAGNTIAGAVQLTNGVHGLRFIANRVRSSATVSGTSGGATTIGGNTIDGWLMCSGNNPVASNGGKPNTAAGRTGECATSGF